MREILKLKKYLRREGIDSKVDIDALGIVLVEEVAILDLQACFKGRVTF